MKIAATDMTLQSQYASTRSLQQSASLQVWSGSRATNEQGQGASGITVNVSDAARTALAESSGNQVGAISDAIDSANADPLLRMIRQMVELLTGEKIRVLSLQDLQASVQTSASVDIQAAQQTRSDANGTGLAYQYHQTLTETQQATLSAEGSVRTADGQVIKFKLDLSMSRSWSEQTDIFVRAGAAQRKDPLVLNFTGSAALLSDRQFSFDLLGDGKPQQIASLGQHTAYLVFDHNGNGKVDSGKELFGPTTGSGFAELAKLDADHNGWIDENDPAFAKLGLWNPGDGHDQPVSLRDHNVGAISRASRNTPFELRGANNASLGAVKSSGVYLGSDGKAGSIQEIDLSV
jgi:hypothetical protein